MANHYQLEQWKDFLNSETTKPYFIDLWSKVNHYYDQNLLFPKKSDVFKALELCTLKNIKVIIIGQDPYHNDNQANGLAFAVNNDCKLPGSLQNIFKELQIEYDVKPSANPDLMLWAQQGVLLLNAVLTVIKHQPLSCQNWGWEKFTLNLIKYILDNNNNLVVICFGKYAQKFVSTLEYKNHCFLNCIHPSPLSAHYGFFNSMVFRKTNEYLQLHHQVKIKW